MMEVDEDNDLQWRVKEKRKKNLQTRKRIESTNKKDMLEMNLADYVRILHIH